MRPSSTTSGVPPTAVATSGSPLASPSMATVGRPSSSEGMTRMSKVFMKPAMSVCCPANRMQSDRPRASTCVLEAPRLRTIADDHDAKCPGGRRHQCGGLDQVSHALSGVQAADITDDDVSRRARGGPPRPAGGESGGIDALIDDSHLGGRHPLPMEKHVGHSPCIGNNDVAPRGGRPIQPDRQSRLPNVDRSLGVDDHAIGARQPAAPGAPRRCPVPETNGRGRCDGRESFERDARRF